MQCHVGIIGGLTQCSRQAVVKLNGYSYCKQHAKKRLPMIEIVKKTENQKGLKQNLVDYMFGRDK